MNGSARLPGRIRTALRIALAMALTALAMAALAAPAPAAIFDVDDARDLPDAAPSDGVCATDPGPNQEPPVCTLRAAVQQANAASDEDTINLPTLSENYVLTAGALAIDFPVEILGESARTTIVRSDLTVTQTPPDRVFDIGILATVRLFQMTVQDGRAGQNNGINGGNIRSAGALTIDNSTVADGIAQDGGGGGIANLGGTLTLVQSTVSGNQALPGDGGGDGGAILNFGEPSTEGGPQPAELTITDSTISGNSAQDGGAILSTNYSGNTVGITGSTIARNTSASGGALNVDTGSAQVGSTIVDNTSSSGGPNCTIGSSGSLDSGGTNLETGSECFTSADVQDTDPQLGDLADNGGGTDTHAVPLESPAVDAYGSAGCETASDQRSVERPQGPVCDIGAFELDQLPYKTISSAGPLTNIYLGRALECQVGFSDGLQFFGDIPGSCGTFLRTQEGAVTLSPLSQSQVTGAGTAADPYRVVTRVAALEIGLELERVDSYVIGESSYRSDITVTNNGEGAQSALLWQAGDCFLLGDDEGYGFYDAGTGGIYCAPSQDISGIDRMLGFVPLSGGSSYYEGGFSAAFSPEAGGFANTCSGEFVDNGIGLSWSIDVPPQGQGSVERSFRTSFTPAGQSCAAQQPPPPPPPDTTPPDTSITVGPSGSTVATGASFSFESSESGSSFECRLDGAAFAACSSPHAYSGLTRTGHTFEVRATDAAGNADPTPASRAWTITQPQTVDQLPPPELGVDANVQELSGNVKVAVPSAAAAGGSGARASQKLRYVSLSDARQIPVGAYLDTRKGTVRLQSSDSKGKRKNGDFSGGVFQLKQSKRKSAKGRTDLILKGGNFRKCRTAGGSEASAALSKRAIRRLRAKAKGGHRSSGKRSAATVRGTTWTVTDRCDGTLTTVQSGSVSVRDFRRKKTVTVRRGKRYLAKAPPNSKSG